MTKVRLPNRVYLKHGSYYYVDMARKWHKLCREREGLPTMYRELARLTVEVDRPGMMPQCIQAWLDDPRMKWSAGHRKTNEAMSLVISEEMAEFHCSEVTEVVCNGFLEDFVDTPSMHNRYRTCLIQILQRAAVKGWRTGANPAREVPRMETRGRHQRVTDADIAKVKAAAMIGKDGLPTDSGPPLCKMIDLALLTGQRIGDIIKMRWQDVTPDGLYVVQQKGRGRRRILIQWSPALKAAVDACAEGTTRIGHLLKKNNGHAYTYWGIRSAWVRACERAGIELDALHIHDMRGRAGVDKAKKDGKEATQQLLGHGSMAMTEHYIEDKADVVVTPAK